MCHPAFLATKADSFRPVHEKNLRQHAGGFSHRPTWEHIAMSARSVRVRHHDRVSPSPRHMIS